MEVSEGIMYHFHKISSKHILYVSLFTIGINRYSCQAIGRRKPAVTFLMLFSNFSSCTQEVELKPTPEKSFKSNTPMPYTLDHNIFVVQLCSHSHKPRKSRHTYSHTNYICLEFGITQSVSWLGYYLDGKG